MSPAELNKMIKTNQEKSEGRSGRSQENQQSINDYDIYYTNELPFKNRILKYAEELVVDSLEMPQIQFKIKKK